MARRIWVLVEWVDESNVFPAYSVVNIDPFGYKESDLQTGKQIFISLKHKDPRRAKIIRISDKKHHVKEHQEFLERQDKQIKNVLQMCMRTIKEMKSDQYSSGMESSLQLGVNGQQSNGMPNVINALSENSASDSESETRTYNKSQMTKASVKYMNQSPQQGKRYESNHPHKRNTHTPVMNQRRCSMVSSTPLPGNSGQDSVKLYFDQGTQTDNTYMQPSVAKIQEIESVLKHLYGRFQSLVLKVNESANATIDLSESEQNFEVSYVDPVTNESWVEPNNVVECAEVINTVDHNVGNIGNNQVVEAQNSNAPEIQVKKEIDRQSLNESMRVRRMSAQTTNTNEMVSIGNGSAMVPARLLNEIDWNSYTTATRQLLQAIFPRKVLATHSLTGKQSPAHQNKPAKKLLDPKLVEDIIKTVSARCGVPKNLVRNTITVKCTDEAKLYRNRQQNRNSRIEKNRQNDENAPPSALPSSDDL